ncbi:MAG TPA: septal ring lytic transglycosylase RlpA family protein [Candidatus Binatia bacterium]|nr:septal ring lytic transglycosylase RlpA family protein [Candidatus Binatia bacterium]
MSKMPKSAARVVLQARAASLILFSFLGQSCGAISDLSQRISELSQMDDQSTEVAHVTDETISSDITTQKVSVESGRKKSSKPATKHALSGTASWYGPGFHGKKTASGKIYDQHKLTAAHKTLPLGTKARVTNLENGSKVEVEINDRGPFIEGRIIDLSRAAAGVLGFVESGLAPVQVELIADS